MFFRNRKLTQKERAIIEKMRRAIPSCECTDTQCKRIQAKMWARIEEIECGFARDRTLRFFGNRFTVVLVSLALVLLLGVGTTVAADKSIPGDALYPVDRAVEKAILAITFNPDARMRLLLSQADERVHELSVVRVIMEGMPEDRQDEYSNIEMEAIDDSSNALGEVVHIVRTWKVNINPDTYLAMADIFSDLDRMHFRQMRDMQALEAHMRQEQMLKDMAFRRAQMKKQYRSVIADLAKMHREKYSKPIAKVTTQSTFDYPSFPDPEL